jgi:hypothetical protein
MTNMTYTPLTYATFPALHTVTLNNTEIKMSESKEMVIILTGASRGKSLMKNKPHWSSHSYF